MKANFNNLSAAAVTSLALVVTLVSPAMAVPENAPQGLQSTNRSSVCTRLDNLGNSSIATISTHVTNLQAGFEARLSKISSNESSINQRITTAREKASSAFQERIQAMESKEGLTDTQIAAIETFKTNVEQAQQIRQTAVDSARSTYRTGLIDVVSANQQQIVQAANEYKVAAEAAFQNASENCANGEATSNLKAEIAAARQILTSARNGEELQAQIQQLRTTRNEAIKAANDAFKTSLATYKADLVATLTATN